jgi:hypothetical protein
VAGAKAGYQPGQVPAVLEGNAYAVDPALTGHRVELRYSSTADLEGFLAQRAAAPWTSSLVAKLGRLGTPGPGQPAWAAVMASKRRKTPVVCQPCDQAIHASTITNAV